MDYNHKKSVISFLQMIRCTKDPPADQASVRYKIDRADRKNVNFFT